MKYDTAGKEIVEPIYTCNCGLTDGCSLCRPVISFIRSITDRNKIDPKKCPNCQMNHLVITPCSPNYQLRDNTMKEELIKLYEEYLANSVEERTHELTDLDNGGKKKVELKGDLEGFIWYLKRTSPTSKN